MREVAESSPRSKVQSMDSAREGQVSQPLRHPCVPHIKENHTFIPNCPHLTKCLWRLEFIQIAFSSGCLFRYQTTGKSSLLLVPSHRLRPWLPAPHPSLSVRHMPSGEYSLYLVTVKTNSGQAQNQDKLAFNECPGTDAFAPPQKAVTTFSHEGRAVLPKCSVMTSYMT